MTAQEQYSATSDLELCLTWVFEAAQLVLVAVTQLEVMSMKYTDRTGS